MPNQFQYPWGHDWRVHNARSNPWPRVRQTIPRRARKMAAAHLRTLNRYALRRPGSPRLSDIKLGNIPGQLTLDGRPYHSPLEDQ